MTKTRYFVPLVRLAEELEIEPTTIRRWCWSERVFWRQRSGSKGYEVDIFTLPPKYRAAYIALHPTLAAGAEPDAIEAQAPLAGIDRFTSATSSGKDRAMQRFEAVLSLTRAYEQQDEDETLGEVEARWERNYMRSHNNAHVSVRSVKRWKEQFEAENLNGLVDGNDGSESRGSRIPAPAKQLFRDLYLRAHQPNLRLCYDSVCIEAQMKGWGEMPTYETFRRYANSMSKLVRALHRENADTPSAVLPYVERDPTSIPVYDTLQLDHHDIDVPVRCDEGCPTCTGKKPKGHFPIWTAWMDIHSRRIMTSDLAIEVPTYRTVLTGLRRLINEHGLMNRLYVDNGSDIKRALGKRMRRLGASWDGPPDETQFETRLAPFGISVTYAIPYNAKAKAIERLFRTFRHRFSEMFEAYRGQFGAKSEQARELFYKPHELPTLSELAYLLQFAIDQYNSAIKHTGKGMSRRTPSEVFAVPGARIPRRDPDPKAFQMIFFEPVDNGGKRIVDRNGVRNEGRTYRLTSLGRQIEYFGSFVDMRTDPDDQRVAALFDLKNGSYICDARVDDAPATYNTRDAVTETLMRRVFRDVRDCRLEAARAIDQGAKQRLKAHLDTRIAFYQQMFARMAEEAAAGNAAAAIGGTTLVMPAALSALARERERTLTSESPFTAEDLALLLSDSTGEANDSREVLTLVPDAAEADEDERLRMAQIRKRHDGLCEIDFCENPVGAGGVFCTSCENWTASK